MDKVSQSYAILDSGLLESGAWIAANGSLYRRIWLRDNAFITMTYKDKHCNTYERTYHTFLDIFRKYEWKIDYHLKVKPVHQHEFIHPRYTADTLEEITDEPFGNCQFDALGLVLFGIGEGERVGKRVLRDEKDREIVQKLVYYLEKCEYYNLPDNGAWEEYRELKSSSVGACVAGLMSVRDIVYVPSNLIQKGYQVLGGMFPYESQTRHVDMIQLSLIYPYNLVFGEDAKRIMDRIESYLVRDKGVARYECDSYYCVPEHERQWHNPSIYKGIESEWPLGFAWLSLAAQTMGDIEKAQYYINKVEEVMTEDGGVPELYLANSDTYNENSPLFWANAKYIQAKEGLEKLKQQG